ncbi:MAG: FHA domain-containing protein [Myxococcota bacterium]
MGAIASLSTGGVRPLRHEHLIGRSPGCDLRVEERLASGVHASLRWVTSGWSLRDLGSKNGTWLDGRRVDGEVLVPVGATLAFGAPGEAWRLVDGSVPRAFGEPLDPGSARSTGFSVGSAEILALPGEGDPVATVLRTPGGWVLERDDGTQDVADREVVDAGGRWRLHLPGAGADRTDVALPQADIDEITLRIAVSRHEEHVEIEVVHRSAVIRVGAYAANELVLALARARLDDLAPTEADRGWVDTDALSRMIRQTPSCVRQWIYLTRQRFEELGIANGSRIVERRAGTREVRLGVRQVRVEPL